MIGGNGSSGNGWTGTSFQTKINSLQFDTGSTLSNQVLAPDTCVFWGDSILQSYYGVTGSEAYYNYVDYTEAWPSYVVSQLGCEYSQIGIGSQGWVYPTGNGGYPVFGSSWNYYDSTHQKIFSTAPTYAIIDMGTNDHGESSSAVATNVSNTLTAMRAAFGVSTRIIIITPYNPTFDDGTGAPRTGIINGYNSYETATPDANAYLIDLGTTVQQYALAPYSADNIHPDEAAHVIIGGVIASDLQTTLPSLQTGTLTTNSITTSTASITSTSPTGGSGIYSYQWYRSTTNGFTPSSGNLLSGATSLTLNDSGLNPGTLYYYKLADTDTFSSTVYSAQQTITTTTTTTGGGGSGGGGSTSYSGGGTYSGGAGTTTPVTPVTPVTPTTPPITQTTPPVNPAGGSISVPSAPKTQGASLINDHGTFYLISGSNKYGITNPGILKSYGYTFTEATIATATQSAISTASNLPPNSGALVKTSSDPTVYLISGSQKFAFTSSQVFTKEGYKFSSVVTVSSPELGLVTQGNPISDPTQAHLPGTNIIIKGIIYWISSDNQLHPYPSLAVYNSWNTPNDFSTVVLANTADLALPISSAVVARS